jgi:hypothetical protein
MKRLFVFLALQLVAVVAFVMMSCKITEPMEYHWNKNYRVQLKDFRLDENMANGSLAVLQSGIHMNRNYEGTGRYKAFAIANRHLSLISKKVYIYKYRQKEILEHEQMHFNITEYVTRLLNSRLQHIKSVNVADKLYDDYNDTLALIQNVYDAQTDHSNDLVWEDKWRSKMDTLLNSVTIRHDWRMYPY